MSVKRRLEWIGMLLLIVVTADVGALGVPASAEPAVDKQKAAAIDLITVEELKAKLNRNEPLTIIDVRASESFANSDMRIKGAVHVKLRRLKSRLRFAPLKDAPRDREVITYCACPGEESAIAAAQVLLSSGFKRVRALKGGWQEWLKTSGPVEPRNRGM